MRILSADLSDFRNIHHAELDPSPRFTALIGPNGQGKTNALEALYFASALRSLRSVQKRALIRAGAKAARIALRIECASTGLTHELCVMLDPASRRTTKDGKQCDASSFLGTAVAVAFTPDDLQLPKGGPDLRRRFIDRALLNTRPAYLQHALRYARALRERNRLLVENAVDALFEAFEEVVAREGTAIAIARARYVGDLSTRVCAEFSRIASPAPELGLRYRSNLGDDLASAHAEHIHERLRKRLESNRATDRRRKSTSSGPHLDDLEITFDGLSARERGSQGQHRALVLALKLAEITHLTESLGEPPILLLDDMSSELDHARSEQLFRAVAGLQGQVLLTSTEEPRSLRASLPGEVPITVYDVREGALSCRRSGCSAGNSP